MGLLLSSCPPLFLSKILSSVYLLPHTKVTEATLQRKRNPQFTAASNLMESRFSPCSDAIGQLLVALVSAYRYEGPKHKEDAAKSEAKFPEAAIKGAEGKSLFEDEEVIRILTTRSKLHLEEVHKHSKEIGGPRLYEDLKPEVRLQETVQCLCTPKRYFCQILDASLKTVAPENMKKALTRVIVTRANADIKEIKEAIQKLYGVLLSN